MNPTIPEQLLLIGYDENGRAKTGGSIELDCGLAGAVLLELSLAGRIHLVDGKVEVLDRTPVGDPEIDAALERIAAEGPAPRRMSRTLGCAAVEGGCFLAVFLAAF